MAFAGLRGTGDWGTDERPKNFRERILWLDPNGMTPLTGLMSMMGKESTVQQGTSHGADAVKIAGTSAAGAAIGGLADRGWRGAGIGAGAGSAVGLATVLLTRGREVELRQGSTMDVTFDRPVSID